MRKAARIHGRGGITSSSRTAFGALPAHKQAYVQRRSEGVPARAAAVEVGFNPAAGPRWDKDQDIQQAYRELVRKAIPAEKLVRLIKGGCEAKMPVYSSDGIKRGERADWKTRKPYIDMASKHGGYYEDKSASNIPAITFVVNHIGRSSQRTISATAEAKSTS